MVIINTRVNLLRIELNDDENKFKNGYQIFATLTQREEY